MKAIIQCYTPQECERIARGEQTVKVCKTAPNEAPFKVYIYCTKANSAIEQICFGKYTCVVGNNKIIGEYVCDKVIKYDYQTIACAKYEVNGADVKEELRYNAGACLTAEEMYRRANGKDLRGLHISELKIYDEPRELSEFVKPCNWNYDCCTCKRAVYELTKAEARLFYGCDRELTRPPQSWCYVEEN